MELCWDHSLIHGPPHPGLRGQDNLALRATHRFGIKICQAYASFHVPLGFYAWHMPVCRRTRRNRRLTWTARSCAKCFPVNGYGVMLAPLPNTWPPTPRPAGPGLSGTVCNSPVWHKNMPGICQKGTNFPATAVDGGWVLEGRRPGFQELGRLLTSTPRMGGLPPVHG